MTDFMVVEAVEEGGIPVSFIEVKSLNTYTSLGAQLQPTAQALREAHILLDKMPAESKLNFILTNSMMWSFGVAQKVGNKIKLLNYFNIYLNSLTKTGTGATAPPCIEVTLSEVRNCPSFLLTTM